MNMIKSLVTARQRAAVAPTPEDEIITAHQVPAGFEDYPFIELSMFLHYKMENVAPGELTPLMISAWIAEHAQWAENHRFTKLAYTVASRPFSKT